jgi:hypothetical protein
MRRSLVPWFLKPVPRELEGLVTTVVARACAEIDAAWPASEARGESLDRRVLETARTVDEFRRLGFLDLSSCEAVKRATTTPDEPAAGDVVAAYRLSLARTLLLPSDLRARKTRLLRRQAAVPRMDARELDLVREP